MPAKNPTPVFELSHAYLLERLHYNPETGIFTWKRHRDTANATKPGEIAGTVSGKRYISIKIRSRSFLAHRLAWFYVTGHWPEEEIDHVNHKGMDNRFCNLRSVTRADNMKNKKLSNNNTSGIAGVYWIGSLKKWEAKIGIYLEHENRTLGKHLGYFKSRAEAEVCRKSAELAHQYHPNHGK